MKAILILARPFSKGATTKNIWQALCDDNHIEFETYDIADAIGKDIAEQHNIKSFPALIVNDKVVAVGHPDEDVARKVFDSIQL